MRRKIVEEMVQDMVQDMMVEESSGDSKAMLMASQNMLQAATQLNKLIMNSYDKTPRKVQSDIRDTLWQLDSYR